MSRRKSPFEPVVEDFLRNHPLSLNWPSHEKTAFVRELATFLERRIAQEQIEKAVRREL